MRLPIFKLFLGSLILVVERRSILFRSIWGPTLIGIALSTYQHLSLIHGSRDSTNAAIAILIFMLTIILAVRSYGVFLGERDTKDSFLISWTMRESRFLVIMILVSFSFGILTLFVGLMVGNVILDSQISSGPLFVFLLLVPGAYLASRVLLVFPLVSVREVTIPDAIKTAWALSGNNVMAILMLCVGIPAGLALCFALMGNVDGLGLLSVILPWVTMPIEFAIIALVFSQLEKFYEKDKIEKG